MNTRATSYRPSAPAMIDLAPADLATVKRLLAAHVPECEVRAFGSRVSGGARPYSDLDLALVGTERMPIQRLFRLKEAFQDSTLPIRVDVIDWQAASAGFREAVGSRYELIQ